MTPTGTEISGWELLLQALIDQGVKYIFTTRADRLEGLTVQADANSELTFIRANDETAAAAMADGFIRRSRTPAAVITGDRGRAIAQVSAVTNAWADKIPLISISTCDDAPVDFNKGILRNRFDQNGVFGPVTVWRSRVDNITDLQRTVEAGINNCFIDKGGPVHIDIPHRLLLQKTVSTNAARGAGAGGAAKRKYSPIRLTGDPKAIGRAATLIRGAKRPLVVAGGGVNSSGAFSELIEIIEKFAIPAATTMAGIGAVPLEHPLCLGGPSYTAGETFHTAIKQADVVIAVGVSFGGLEGFGLPPLWSDKIKFIQIDSSAGQIGLNVSPEVAVLGDAKTVLRQLIGRLEENNFGGRPVWSQWRNRLSRLKEERRKRLEEDAVDDEESIHQGLLVTEISRFLERDDFLLAIDGGNTPLYASMYAPSSKPLTGFFPFGMAALGAGIPYAIGVALASPERKVVLLTGDGSFMYHVQEIETMRRLKLPITIIINNDSAWNMIKAMQDSFFARNYVGTCLPNIDYAEIARGFGLHAERVIDPKEIAPAYERAQAADGPTLIDCITDCRNLPDSLVTFALVEFEGALTSLNPFTVAKSLLLMTDLGFRRIKYMTTYIIKALLGINIDAGEGGAK